MEADNHLYRLEFGPGYHPEKRVRAIVRTRLAAREHK